MRTEVVQAIRRGRGAATVTIWRAGPVPEFNTGDWVSLSCLPPGEPCGGRWRVLGHRARRACLVGQDDLAEWDAVPRSDRAQHLVVHPQRGVTTSVEDLGEVALYTFTATEAARPGHAGGRVPPRRQHPWHRQRDRHPARVPTPGRGHDADAEAVSVRDSLWPGRAMDMGTFTQDGSKWWSSSAARDTLLRACRRRGRLRHADRLGRQHHSGPGRPRLLQPRGGPASVGHAQGADVLDPVDALRRYIETVLRNEGITVPVEIVIWPEGTGQAAAASCKQRSSRLLVRQGHDERDVRPPRVRSHHHAQQQRARAHISRAGLCRRARPAHVGECMGMS